jgi:type II secretory pathway component PulF
MGQFLYKAVDRSGGHTSGAIEAVDRRNAVCVLADKGQLVTELTERRETFQNSNTQQSQQGTLRTFRFGLGRITGKDVLAVTSQLSATLRAGLPLLSGLEIIRKQLRKAPIKNVFDDLINSVRSGKSLSEALAQHQNIFSPLYISMIRVGETGGILDQTTVQLSQILDRDEKVKTSLKNALAYPIFVLFVGFISVTIILTWVLPNILDTISGGVAILPWPTRMLMAVSWFIKSYGWLAVIVVVVVIYSFKKWTRSKGRLRWDTFRLKVPILASVLRTIAVGRFTRTLGALTKGGITILESLGIVRDTLGNEFLGREIDTVAEKVKSGASLADPLEASGCFPPLLVQIVAIGEQTGKLDSLLLDAADTFDGEADAAITRFMAIFPAILILLLALVVGFIIAATLLPIVAMQLGAAGL